MPLRSLKRQYCSVSPLLVLVGTSTRAWAWELMGGTDACVHRKSSFLLCHDASAYFALGFDHHLKSIFPRIPSAGDTRKALWSNVRVAHVPFRAMATALQSRQAPLTHAPKFFASSRGGRLADPAPRTATGACSVTGDAVLILALERTQRDSGATLSLSRIRGC